MKETWKLINCIIGKRKSAEGEFKAARAPDARFASGFTFYHLSKHKTVLYRFIQ